MRPQLRTICWLCVLSGISLSGIARSLSGPASPPSDQRSRHSSIARDDVRDPIGSELSLTSTTPGVPSLDADGPDFDEDDEDESSWSLSHRACLTSTVADPPRKLLSGPRPGHSPPRTAAVPLRC